LYSGERMRSAWGVRDLSWTCGELHEE